MQVVFPMRSTLRKPAVVAAAAPVVRLEPVATKQTAPVPLPPNTPAPSSKKGSALVNFSHFATSGSLAFVSLREV